MMSRRASESCVASAPTLAASVVKYFPSPFVAVSWRRGWSIVNPIEYVIRFCTPFSPKEKSVL
jgi:hypothetical protein